MGKPHETAQAFFAPGKGVLVVDEYAARLVPGGRGDTVGGRAKELVELTLTTPGLGVYVSGVLLTRETFQATALLREILVPTDGAPPLRYGVRMHAERTRPGADGGPSRDLGDLRGELADVLREGASFVEWRANLSPMAVRRGGVHADTAALALGAAVSQAEGLLPVVTVAMPDLASQSLAVTQAATANALRQLVSDLARLDVDPSGLVLRVNMVLAGDAHPRQAVPSQVAAGTLRALQESLPAELAGVAFLSGGQPIGRATTNLAAVAELGRSERAPWPVTFAFTRALLQEGVDAWGGDPENVPAAQREIVKSCRAAAQAVSPVSGWATSA